MARDSLTFQQTIHALNDFWDKQGCLILQAYDLEKGASTMNPGTFLRVLGPEPWKMAVTDPCRRPTDGRYGDNPNRLQHYFQYQVILKPSPDDVQEVYLDSLRVLGINPEEHDIRFVEDNWESPTLGAWGVGWEVWLDGLEITQFTYFQQAGGLDVKPVAAEITYGLERISMYLQNVDSVYQLKWNDSVLYGELYHNNEVEQSKYNFEKSNAEVLPSLFETHEGEADRLLGEKLVMRIFDPEVLLRSFDDLGLNGDDLSRWVKMMESPNGIVLVTGPTGSGKTTTLYSSLKTLANDEVNVSTIEDPIEMAEDAFNQTQVQHNIGLDFAQGIRTLMRQDPDIIMVGEIRDLETAQMAVQAALTGHLVISTLHTNDAPTSISRLLDLGIPSYLLKATVLGVMAQRLVRTLCPHCKQESDISIKDWDDLVKPWKVAKPNKVFRAVGCLECRNTGYMGRQGIYELLSMSENIANLISDDTDLNALRQQAMREGMRTLRLSGAKKLAAGLTTLEEVLRVAPPSTKYQ